MWHRIRSLLARDGGGSASDVVGGAGIAQEFEKRQPWVTKFSIDGVTYGGAFDAMNDARLTQFHAHFPDVKTILELGSLEGGHSFGLASHSNVERIVALEGRSFNIERARFVQKLLGVDKVKFIEVNLEETDLAVHGQFDAVFCAGLLYHLPEPWKLIAQCARVGPGLFIWTHYAADNNTVEVNGYQGKWYQESGLRDPLSGMSKESFWPTLTSLKAMLTQKGFGNVHVIEDDPKHPHGPAVTLAAKR
ncbi:MAG: class I SAM-dependent methyltransferase [Gammaproteobacteria bacterium]